MKVNELLVENLDDDEFDEKFIPVMQKLVGFKFNYRGAIEHEVVSVKRRKHYGNNFDIKVKPSFGQGYHPYGDFAITKKFRKVTGLSMEFSESGMQEKSVINVDVGGEHKSKPALNVKKELAKVKDFILGRGWELANEYPESNSYRFQMKGRGFIWLQHAEDTEHNDEHILINSTKIGRYTADNAEEMIKDMSDEGDRYMKSLFKVPDLEAIAKKEAAKAAKNSAADDTKYKDLPDFKELAARYEVKKFATGKLEFEMESKEGSEEPNVTLIVMDNGYVRLKFPGITELRMIRKPPGGSRQGNALKKMVDSDSEEGKAVQAAMDARLNKHRAEELRRALAFANEWSKKYKKGAYAK